VQQIDRLKGECKTMKEAQIVRWFGVSTRSYRRWKSGQVERKERGSDLTHEEVKAVVDNIQEYPHMGGKKGSATLAYHEKAAVGSGTYDEIKSQVYEKMKDEVESRKLLRKSKQSFNMPGFYGPGEAWGTDIATVTIRGESVFLCKVLDLFTLERVGLSAGRNPDGDFVEEAFLRAKMKEGRWPKRFILSDNGSPYKAIVFEEFFGAGGPAWKFITPGCPWYNGKVENSWKDDKAVFWALYARSQAAGESLVDKVSQLMGLAMEKLNNDIPCRCLGDVTPRDIRDGRQEQQQDRMARFKQRARKERKSQERVGDLEAGVKRHLSLEDMSDPVVKNLFALLTKNYKLVRKGVSDNFARTACQISWVRTTHRSLATSSAARATATSALTMSSRTVLVVSRSSTTSHGLPTSAASTHSNRICPTRFLFVV